MRNILFVCNGNSCRSQMAEGWMNALSHGHFAAESGGIEPHGLNPLAVTVMAEKNVDISSQRSKELSQNQLNWADLVITVCGGAGETCPILPPGTHSEHWPLKDPAQAKGIKEDILKTFRETRDEIHDRVVDLIERLHNSEVKLNKVKNDERTM